jgi:hypothetical protein
MNPDDYGMPWCPICRIHHAPPATEDEVRVAAKAERNAQRAMKEAKEAHEAVRQAQRDYERTLTDSQREARKLRIATVAAMIDDDGLRYHYRDMQTPDFTAIAARIVAYMEGQR